MCVTQGQNSQPIEANPIVKVGGWARQIFSLGIVLLSVRNSGTDRVTSMPHDDMVTDTGRGGCLKWQWLRGRDAGVPS